MTTAKYETEQIYSDRTPRHALHIHGLLAPSIDLYC